MTDGSAAFLAYGITAPFFFGFAKWLCETAIKDGVETLYFLSQDGESVKKCYDVLAPYYPEAPRSDYIYASWRSLHVPSIKNEQDIQASLNRFFPTTDLETLLSCRLGVETVPKQLLQKHGFRSLKDKVNHSRHLDAVVALALDLAPRILEQASKENEALLTYYREHGLAEKGHKAIVTIGHHDSLQDALSRLTGNDTLGCYSFASYAGENADNKPDTEERPSYTNNAAMFDLLFSSCEGSFKKMEKQTPCFFEPAQSQTQKEFLTTVHEQAVQLCTDIADVMGNRLQGADWPAEGALLPYATLLSGPGAADARLFLGLQSEDFYGALDHRTVLHYNPESTDESVRESLWQAGARALASSS